MGDPEIHSDDDRAPVAAQRRTGVRTGVRQLRDGENGDCRYFMLTLSRPQCEPAAIIYIAACAGITWATAIFDSKNAYFFFFADFNTRCPHAPSAGLYGS